LFACSFLALCPKVFREDQKEEEEEEEKKEKEKEKKKCFLLFIF